MADATNTTSYSECIAAVSTVVSAFVPEFVTQMCSACCKLASAPITPCTGCNFVAYCGAECAAKAWPEHKHECDLLKGKLDEWKAFLPKYDLIDGTKDDGFRMNALLLFRLVIKRDTGALAAATGELSGKTFDELLSNEGLVEIGETKYGKRLLRDMLDVQRCASFLYGENIDDPTVLEYCLKIMKNSSCCIVQLPDSPAGEGLTCGTTLCLDYSVSMSCRPNAQVIVGNAKGKIMVCIVPLPDAKGKPLFNANEVNEFTRSGIVLVATKGARRGQIDNVYHYKCECERCVDPADDFLSAIVCEKCRAPIPIDDSPFRRCPAARFSEKQPPMESTRTRMKRILPDAFVKYVVPKLVITEKLSDFEYSYHCFGPELKNASVVCSACGAKQPAERVEFAFALMTVIESFAEQPLSTEQLSLLAARFDVESAKILPDCNLYRAKLHRMMAEDPRVEPSVRANRMLKWFGVVQKCVPRGCAQLSLVEMRPLCEALIAAKKFDELRCVLVDGLERERILFCADMLKMDVKVVLFMLGIALHVTSEETDFSSVLSKLNGVQLAAVLQYRVGAISLEVLRHRLSWSV